MPTADAPLKFDLPIKPDLQDLLGLEPCKAFKIPSPKPLKITLPITGELHAFTDLSKGIPNDCSMTFSLLLQIAPLLAAMDCLLKILKLLKPLVDIVTGPLQHPPKPPTPELITDAVQAGIDLIPCFTMINLPFFAKDLLCLVRAVLRCLLQQMISIRDLLSGLSLRLEAAAGNDDLLATIQCAQDNANAAVDNIVTAIEPISAILGLMSPVLGLAGLPSIELKTPAVVSPDDLESMNAMIDALQGVVDAIDEVTGGICGP
jgi:hypothetical protein